MKFLNKAIATGISVAILLQAALPLNVFAQNNEANATAVSDEHISESYNVHIEGTVNIGGTPVIGGVLRSTVNVEKGPDKSALSYQWQYSEDGKNFTDIKGATGADYEITANEGGAYRVVVSDSTGKYSGEIVSPVFQGEIKVGFDGGVVPGDIAATHTLFVDPEDEDKLTYVWQLSDNGTDFKDIAVSEENTYTVTSNETGKYLRTGISLDGENYVYSDSRVIAAADAVQAAANESGAAIGEAEEFYLSDLGSNTALLDKLMPVRKVGYSTLKFNTKLDSANKISLYVDGKKTEFDKGFTAHADAELVFDVGTLVSEYGYNSFSTYMGLDTIQGSNGNGVIFKVYSSDDSRSWSEIKSWSNIENSNLIKETRVLKGNSNCQDLTLDIRNIKYLRFEISDNGSNSNDHSVLAGIKVMKAVYDKKYTYYDFIKTVPEYDKAIDNYGSNYGQLAQDADYIALLQQRTIVENAGYDLLQDYANRSEEYRAAMEKFFTDKDALNLFTNGGPPKEGNYLQAIKVILDLYSKHPEDINNPLYKRMMMADAITNSLRIGTWYGLDTTCDPVKRYEIFKHLRENGYLVNNAFDNLTVAEMRYVFEDTISDEEIEWLNFYHRKYKLGKMHPTIQEFNANKTGPGPYSYITYTGGYNYDLPQYYAEENKAMWQEKYHLVKSDQDPDDDDFDFNIPYGDRRLWIVFNEGSVCGGIAQTGAHIFTVNGIPAHHHGQPGHAAYIYYNYDNDGTDPAGGNGKWYIGNDVSGWTRSYTYNAYLPLNWGHQAWRNTNNLSYIFLIQAVLNDYNSYEESEKYVKVADYKRVKGEYAQAIELYNKALEVEKLDYNAWIGLYETYVKKNASETEWVALAQKAADSLTYYPTPMYDYINTAIKPHLTDQLLISDLSVALNNALVKATTATANDTLQYNECRLLAKFILGEYDMSLAKFSFDGEKANTIVLSDQFQNTNNQFLYSLDRGDNWVNAGNDENGNPLTEKKLSKDEIKSITAANNIWVKLQGTDNYYEIDITDGVALFGHYVNDNENRVVDVADTAEYSADGGETWIPFTKATEFEGDWNMLIRAGAHGTVLPGPSIAVKFTKDPDDDEISYIQLDRVSVYSYSSQQNGSGNADHSIDGNINSVWHTRWDGLDHDRYVIYKFDDPVYLTAVDYTPSQTGNNGRFSACEVYTSLDGENWVLAGSVTGWATDTAKKRLKLYSPSQALYAKVVCTQGYGGFGSAAMMEFFEDLTYQGKTMTEIELQTPPAKKDYVVGDTLNTAGMRVVGRYDDDSTSIINPASLTYSKTVFDKEGKEKIDVTYTNELNSLSFDVNVAANTKTPVSLSIEKLPDKTRYFVGEELDISGMTVKAQYEDGTSGYVFDYNVDSVTFESPGTASVNVSYKNTSATFEVTVIKLVTGITVSNYPNKMQYMIGETFDPTGLEVTAQFDDGTSAVIPSNLYTVNSDKFSELSGSRKITVTLVNRDYIETDFNVTVQAVVSNGYLRFDIGENDYTCYVSGFDREHIPINASIPDKITINGIDYTVVGVASGAFDFAYITSVDFPGTIKDIQSKAFSNCYIIEEVYFIDHNSFDDLYVAEDAFESYINDGRAYVSFSELADDLENKDGIKGKFNVESLSEDIEEIEVTPPLKTNYYIGEELDLTGFEVRADISGNGQKNLLSSNNYEIIGDTLRCGDITITVRLKDNKDVKDSFKIKVEPARPIVSTQPVSALYVDGDTIAPLVTKAFAADKGTITYQWYKCISETGEIDTENDNILKGETEPTFTPTEEGYYYAVITNSDGENFDLGVTTHTKAARIMMGNYPVIVGKIGYNTLHEAAAAAKDGDTIYVNDDITLTNNVVLNKTVKITSNGSNIYTVKRGAGMESKQMFTSTTGTVTFENIVIDGGAKWAEAAAGNSKHTFLNRSTDNSGIISNTVMIYISGGKLVLGKGAVLQNNCNRNSTAYDKNGGTGGAVCTKSSVETVINGAVIKDNESSFGAAIFTLDTSSINLISGTMSGNYSRSSGAAVCADNNSSFVMNDGIIENNFSDNNSAVWMGYKNFTMNGGTIRNNGGNFGAINATSGGSVIINGGTIEKNGSGTRSMNIGGNGTLTIGNPKKIEGNIYLNGVRVITFTGNTAGKDIFVELGGTGWNDGTVVAKAENTAFAKAAKDSLRISGKLVYLDSDNKTIKIKSADTKKYDVDNDGYITYSDPIKLLKKVSEIHINAVTDSRADVNGDGKIDMLDVIALLKYLQG